MMALLLEGEASSTGQLTSERKYPIKSVITLSPVDIWQAYSCSNFHSGCSPKKHFPGIKIQLIKWYLLLSAPVSIYIPLYIYYIYLKCLVGDFESITYSQPNLHYRIMVVRTKTEEGRLV